MVRVYGHHFLLDFGRERLEEREIRGERERERRVEKGRERLDLIEIKLEWIKGRYMIEEVARNYWVKRTDLKKKSGCCTFKWF